MSAAVDELLQVLDLEQIEQNIFRGISPQVGWPRIFGGLVIAQALIAAERTVEGRAAHSLHAYFILPGDPTVPIVYEVDRIRDGKSFTTRRCVAIQRGKAIFALSASFHVQEPGLEHQMNPPDVPPPEDLPSEAELRRRFSHAMPDNIRKYFERERPIEIRPTDPQRYVSPPPHAVNGPVQNVWVRAVAPLPQDQVIHRAVLAYLSDMTLLDTALIAHGRSIFDPAIQGASLDHSLWFHAPVQADQWMLYAQDSPSSGHARALTRGQIFSRDGKLLASVVQEGLIRLRK